MGETSIKEALKTASSILQNQKEAAILLSFFLNEERLFLLKNENEPLHDLNGYLQLIKRRQKGEPIEYITKSVSFYSRDFFIEKGALIPRPETELLIDHAKKIIEEDPVKNIAEIGVGSGVISVMLATFFPDIQIVATDINKKALLIAETNAKKFATIENIRFVHTSYLDDIDENFDMIVSNPPYIAKNFKPDKNLAFEPKSALFGGWQGDEIVKRIIDLFVEKGVKYLVCEIGYDQRESIDRYFAKKGLRDFYFYKDYSGFDRGFVAVTRRES